MKKLVSTMILSCLACLLACLLACSLARTFEQKPAHHPRRNNCPILHDTNAQIKVAMLPKSQNPDIKAVIHPHTRHSYLLLAHPCESEFWYLESRSTYSKMYFRRHQGSALHYKHGIRRSNRPQGPVPFPYLPSPWPGTDLEVSQVRERRHLRKRNGVWRC